MQGEKLEALIFCNFLDNIVDAGGINAIIEAVSVHCLVVFDLQLNIKEELLPLFTLIFIITVKAVEHHIADANFYHTNHPILLLNVFSYCTIVSFQMQIFCDYNFLGACADKVQNCLHTAAAVVKFFIDGIDHR